MAVKVLSFMAHPDDAEMLCSGTLIRLKQEAGCDIAIVSATSGDCGTLEHDPNEIARIRYREGKDGAAVLGAEYHAAGCTGSVYPYVGIVVDPLDGGDAMAASFKRLKRK